MIVALHCCMCQLSQAAAFGFEGALFMLPQRCVLLAMPVFNLMSSSRDALRWLLVVLPYILPPSNFFIPDADAVQVTVDNIDADLFATGIRGGMFQPADQTLHRVRTATHDLVRAAFADSLARGRPHPASHFYR